LTGIEGGQKTTPKLKKGVKISQKKIKTSKIDQKMMSKNSKKNTILNGKIEKMTKID